MPVENSLTQNAKMVIQQAERTAKFDIRVDTFAFGKEALADPLAMVELARVTNGVYTPVADLAALGSALAKANFSGVDELAIRNRTTEQPAAKLLRHPDGFFAALVPMRAGENTIEVVAPPAGIETRSVSYGASLEEVLPPALAKVRDALRGAP